MAMSLSAEEKMKLLARYGTSCWRKDCNGPPGCLMRHLATTKGRCNSTPETVMNGTGRPVEVNTISGMSPSATVSPAPTVSPAASTTKPQGGTPPCCVRVRKATFEHWSSSPDHVYIGRDMTHIVTGAVGSKWQNPFPSQDYGVQECLVRYEEHVRGSKELLNSIIELEGKVMGCWCKPSPCHGDVLIKLFKELHGELHPDIVEISTQVAKDLARDENDNVGESFDTSKQETEAKENAQLSDLVSSFLSGIFNLDLEAEQTFTRISERTKSVEEEMSKEIEGKSDIGISRRTRSEEKELMEEEDSEIISSSSRVSSPRGPVTMADEYLNSFNISADEERTAASYVDLLKAYHDIFQKWQTLNIQSQLKDMKLRDLSDGICEIEMENKKLKETNLVEKEAKDQLEAKLHEMVEKLKQTSQVSKEESSKDDQMEPKNKDNWSETLKELEERRNLHNLLKEQKEETLKYMRENEQIKKELTELEQNQENVRNMIDAEKEATVMQTKKIDELMLSDNKLRNELMEKDERIKLLDEKLERKSEEEKNLRNKILSVEGLKIEHIKNLFAKDEKIKALMEQIVARAEENKLLRTQRRQEKDEERSLALKEDLERSKGEVVKLQEKLQMSHENVEELVRSLMAKEKELEERKKEVDEIRMSNDIDQNQGKLSKTQEELKKSHENVDELIKKIRSKEKETVGKEEEIDELRRELKQKEARNKLLEENLECLRDEKVKIKNAKKVEKNEDIIKISSDFQDFKREITRQIQAFSNQNHQKKAEIKPSENSKQSSAMDAKIRNETRCKRKPNQNDSLTSVAVTDSEIESGDEDHTNDDRPVGRWKLVDGLWEQLPIRPGTKSYKGAVDTGRRRNIKDQNTLIISTSITKGINIRRFKNCYEGSCKFVRHHGAKARWIRDDVKENLPQGECTSVILQMGGNDLQDLYTPDRLNKLADTIIETGNICKGRGTETVFIGGVPVRKYEYTWERCRDLNKKLRDLCRRNNFIFIDNSDITHSDHLKYDGVHLNDDGDRILANNYLDYLRKEFSEES